MKKFISRIILAILICCMLVSCTGTSNPYELSSEEIATINDAQHISIIEALVYPERYYGQWVTIHGVLKEEDNGYVLYQTIPAAKFPNEREGIWLGDLDHNSRIDKETLTECDKWFISVTGLFASTDTAYPCKISDVLLIEKSEFVRDRDPYHGGYDYLGDQLLNQE